VVGRESQTTCKRVFFFPTIASGGLGGPQYISPCSPKNSPQHNSLIMEINSLIPSCYVPDNSLFRFTPAQVLSPIKCVT
jgi:hypothetical protein